MGSEIVDDIPERPLLNEKGADLMAARDELLAVLGKEAAGLIVYEGGL